MKSAYNIIRNMARKRNPTFASFASLVGIVILSVFVSMGYAHEGEIHETSEKSLLHWLNPTTLITLSAVAISACVMMMLSYGKTLDKTQKKIIFGTIVVASLVTTGYLIGSTVYVAVTSWSGGLVHWHADFEIWICGERVLLPEATGLTNRIGTSDVHHHNDYRIHLEGVMETREQASLGNFFDVIDVPFSNTQILHMNNGEYCPDGSKGSVKMFINGDLYDGNYRDYVIAPYSNVPPGDSIRIVFE